MTLARKYKTLFVDEDFVERFALSFKTGRGFRRELATDRNAFLVNEQAAHLFGKQSLLGKEIEVLGDKRGPSSEY